MLNGSYDHLTREDLRKTLNDLGILERVRESLNTHVKHSIKSLAVLPESEYRQCLEDIAAYVSERNN